MRDASNVFTTESIAMRIDWYTSGEEALIFSVLVLVLLATFSYCPWLLPLRYSRSSNSILMLLSLYCSCSSHCAIHAAFLITVLTLVLFITFASIINSIQGVGRRLLSSPKQSITLSLRNAFSLRCCLVSSASLRPTVPNYHRSSRTAVTSASPHLGSPK
jgi:hypothetical protein